MTDIQERLLGLLLEIDEICRENDIEYCIDGGTALGAVRHRGFLPWDDDADILFTRDNWEKFRRVVKENPRKNRIIEDIYSNPDYTMVYGRYCDTTTTCILRTSMIDQFKSGLFIDLFILDPIPDTEESKKEYFDILSGYCEYLNPYYYDDIIGANEWYDTFVKMEVSSGRHSVIEFVEKHLFSYSDEEGMTYGFRYDNGHWIYPRHVIGKPRRVPFENVMLPVAEKVEDYLRIHYGDNWNMIPSSNEAETHNVVIDLNVPYQQFVDSYMYKIDRDKAKSIYKKSHALNVERRKINTVIDTHNYMITAKLFALALTKKLESKGLSFQKMIAEREYDMVRRELDNYYTLQLHRWYMFYHVFVPLSDEQLFGALYLMLVDGNYSKAYKILALRKEQGNRLPDNLVYIEKMITDIRKSVVCFEENRLNDVLDISARYRREHPDIINFIENELRAEALLVLETGDQKKAIELIDKMNAQEERVRSLDWIVSMRSMLQIRYGSVTDVEEGKSLLCDMMENSENGMLRLAVKDFLTKVK